MQGFILLKYLDLLQGRLKTRWCHCWQDCWSSKESTYVDSFHSDNDKVQHTSTSDQWKKKLLRFTLPCKSIQLCRLIEILDHTIDWRRTDWSRLMCLKVEVIGGSKRQAPNNILDWAMELFSWLMTRLLI